MARILVDNVWARVEGDAPTISQRLLELERDLPGYTLRHKDGSFMAGVVSLLDTVIPVEDRRQRPPAINKLPEFLRDYQQQAVRVAIEHSRGIIKSPTGSGKTAIGAGLIGAVPIRWAYLVPAPSLAVSVANWIRERLKEPVGEVHGTVKKLEGRIMVATLDSVWNYAPAADFLANAEGLIVDEVHRIATDTGIGCAAHARNAYYRIGLSATPFQRSDTKNILVQGLLGPLIHEITIKKLEDAGAISRLHFMWVQADHLIGSSGSWPEFYNTYIVNAVRRNRGIKILAEGIPKPAFIFVKTRAHAQLLHRILTETLGSKVAAVDGDVSVEDRQKVIKGLNTGSLDVVISTKVFFEGIDAPNIMSVVVATAYQSAIEAIQIAGRGSRRAPGKQDCYIFDFADSGHKWLNQHTLARYQAYKEAGYELPHPFQKSPGDQRYKRLGRVVFCILSALLLLYLFSR